MNLNFPISIVFTVSILSCSFPSGKRAPVFSVNYNDQGLELFERDKPVFFYQKMPKSLTGQHICNNYLHPLYSLEGDTLTEEFPADHLFHRGIFWAWHQLFINDTSIGDGWIMENISQEVTGIRTDLKDNSAVLDLEVLWKSSAYRNEFPFIRENTRITVHALESSLRKIDFEIYLNSLVSGVQIGGSDDQKGYGGFCIRIKQPDDLTFTSEGGRVIPQTLQLKAGSWMDFSGGFDPQNPSGITILSHASNPGYPEPWILRQKSSMQNAAYPGREKISLEVDKPLVLRYRLIVHNGLSGVPDFNKLLKEYRKL